MKLLNLFDLLLELEFCIGSSSNLQFNLIFIPSIFSKKIFHHLYWIFKYTFDNSFTCSTSNINFLGVNKSPFFAFVWSNWLHYHYYGDLWPRPWWCKRSYINNDWMPLLLMMMPPSYSQVHYELKKLEKVYFQAKMAHFFLVCHF